jgi:sugar phosphate permease
MDGIRGLHNWRWIFILEGVFTIVVAITAYFFIVNFPEEAKFLTGKERAWLMKKTGRNNEPTRDITVKDFFNFLSKSGNFLGGIMYFGKSCSSYSKNDSNFPNLAMIVPPYSFSYFGPTLVKTLGYSVVETQLHTVPPYAAAIALALLLAFVSDRVHIRFPFVLFCHALILTGLIILFNVQHHFKIQYAAIHLAAMGAYAGGPLIICWFIMNLRGYVERSIGTAFLIGFGNCGDVVATFAFLATDAPQEMIYGSHNSYLCWFGSSSFIFDTRTLGE